MSYKDLYEYCQGLDPVVNRNLLRDKILELTGATGFRFFVDRKLDPLVVRGYYVSPTNGDSQFARQSGGKHVIVFAEGLNRCWQRFVTIKEMMHLFDDALEWTNSEADLEMLLSGFYGSADTDGKMCPQLLSEIQCFWMAIGVVCPERIRIDLQQKRDAGTISDLEIAQYLRMPEVYVPSLFHPNYKQTITRLISQ